jgi:multifunctional 2-oxoglutarate metabolism enzyme
VSEQRPSDVLGALPRRRPHRRSAKRGAPPQAGNGNGTKPTATETAPTATKTAPTAAKTAPRARRPAAAKPAPPAAKPAPPQAPSRATARRPQRLRQPAQPAGVPPTSPGRPAEDQPKGRHVLGTAAQAAAELAEIGLSVSARALRRVIDRLPRP